MLQAVSSGRSQPARLVGEGLPVIMVVGQQADATPPPVDAVVLNKCVV